MKREAHQWVVVARLSDSSGSADLAVSMLQAAGIPVMRFPLQPSPIFPQNLEPVRIMVPPERAEQAKEVLRGVPGSEEA